MYYFFLKRRWGKEERILPHPADERGSVRESVWSNPTVLFRHHTTSTQSSFIYVSYLLFLYTATIYENIEKRELFSRSSFFILHNECRYKKNGGKGWKHKNKNSGSIECGFCQHTPSSRSIENLCLFHFYCLAGTNMKQERAKREKCKLVAIGFRWLVFFLFFFFPLSQDGTSGLPLFTTRKHPPN